ncbi:MAG: hypothetical protein R3C49_01910 [Planctomycetaceae bacterium]
MKYRLWVRRPRFSQDDAEFADQTLQLELRDPKGEVVETRSVRTDRWGGIDGQWQTTKGRRLAPIS